MGSHPHSRASRPRSSWGLTSPEHISKPVVLRSAVSLEFARRPIRAEPPVPHHTQNASNLRAQDEYNGKRVHPPATYVPVMGGAEPSVKHLETRILEEAAATALLVSVLEQLPEPDSTENAKPFLEAVDYAPISKQSLGELDISSIINNAKLRHDINFDRELHFRPNLDGQKGQVKRQTQKDYWRAITAELSLYRALYSTLRLDLIQRGLSYERHRNLIQKRIPSMFATIKDIVKNLVPERDQNAVQEGIDVAVIMQEIERNVCDFVTIVEGIATLLKKHCAPMRDEMVDAMVRKIAKGDPAWISAGLCDLFGVLEAMKLDVANHQIRHLRYPLIEDTINFEKRYHHNRIERKKINANSARQWYLAHLYELEGEPYAILAGKTEFRAFVTAFVRHLLPTCPLNFPDTFNLDSRRLRGLRAEIQDMHFQNICLEVFENLAREVRGIHKLPRAVISELQRDLQAITGPINVPGGMSAPSNFGYIITEMVRHVLRLCGIRSGHNPVLAQRVEERLFEALSSRDVIIYHAQKLETLLTASVLASAENERYLTSSPCDIFNALVPPPTPTPPRFAAIVPYPSQTRPDGQSDVAQRVTHVAVLHWRIWAELVYLNENINPNEAPADVPSRVLSPVPAAIGSLSQVAATLPTNVEGSQSLAQGTDQQPVHATISPP